MIPTLKTPCEINHICNTDVLQGDFVDEQFFDWKTGQLKTPTSITGSVVTDYLPYSSSIGWVTMSFQVDYLGDLLKLVNLVIDTLAKHLQDDVIDDSSTYRGYRQAIRLSSGAIVAYSKSRKDFILVLEQSVCESMQLVSLLRLIKDFVDGGGRITRLDLTVDDFTHSLNLKEIHEAYQAGCMVARTKFFKYDAGFSSPGVKDGEVIRIGKRSSQFFVRIYNKFFESKGKVDSIRFEAELKQDLAHHSFLRLFLSSCAVLENLSGANSLELDLKDFNATLLGIISKKVEFKEPTSDSNVTRRSRLYWWDQFLQGVQQIKIEIPRVKATIKTIESWFLRSVVTSLALLVASQGDNSEKYLKGIIELGYSKFNGRHKAVLREAKELAASVKPNYYKDILNLQMPLLI